MNYSNHYGALIERARVRKTPDSYVERHHVVPKCLGGSDEPGNLVFLTAEEHFVAHQLLAKIHPNSEHLIYAACMMTQSPSGQRTNNRLYGWLKKRLSRVQSERFKGKEWTFEQNNSRSETVKNQWADPAFREARSAAMRGRKWSPESRAAKSASMRGKPGRVWTAEQKAKLSESKRKSHLLKGADNVRSLEGSIS